MLDMAILLLVPLAFCLACWESGVTPPAPPSQDEYSILLTAFTPGLGTGCFQHNNNS